MNVHEQNELINMAWSSYAIMMSKATSTKPLDYDKAAQKAFDAAEAFARVRDQRAPRFIPTVGPPPPMPHGGAQGPNPNSDNNQVFHR
jgi:hypothetical protein